MEQEIHITLRFNMATGKVGLNEKSYIIRNRFFCGLSIEKRSKYVATIRS